MFHPPAAPRISRTPADLAPMPLYRPTTIAEAVSALQHSAGVVYAGGTDFFAGVRHGLMPRALVWVAGIAEMRGCSIRDGVLRIGALTTHDEAVGASELDAVPGLAASWAKIATIRIRHQATLGGNLMARRERYELSILLTALHAVAHMAGPAGERSLPVQDLWHADLSQTPLLVSVSIPLRDQPRLDYERSMRPTFTQALCRRGDALRFVIATEWQRPWFGDAPVTCDPDEVLSRLPDDYSDPGVSREHLVRAGGAFLTRQILRLEEAS